MKKWVKTERERGGKRNLNCRNINISNKEQSWSLITYLDY